MRHGLSKFIAETIYRMRTESGSPGRQATALGLGVFIGATPFWGVHFAMCLVAGRFLRLNPVTMYAGAQITHPLIAPFVYFIEIQIGSWIRRGTMYGLTLAEFRGLSVWSFAADVCAGAVVVGVLVGGVLGGLLFALLRRRAREPERVRVAAAAARRYFDQGIAPWEYAWAKLKGDPVYIALLERRLLPDGGVVLDLGCGRGLLFALLHEAEEMARNGEWPAAWPAPPQGLLLHGIELRPRPGAVARNALGKRAVIEIGDIRHAPFPRAAAVTLLDVLHYLTRDEQDAVLHRVARVLPAGGVLLVREADAAGGWRFTSTRLAELASSWARGHFRQRFVFRTAAEWVEALSRLGFVVDAAPMAEGTPFANVLLRAVKS